MERGREKEMGPIEGRGLRARRGKDNGDCGVGAFHVKE